MFKKLLKWFSRVPSDQALYDEATKLTSIAITIEDEIIAKDGTINPELREHVFAASDAAWRRYRKHVSISTEKIFPIREENKTKGTLYKTADLIKKVRVGHIKYGYGTYQVSEEETTFINIYIDDIKHKMYRKDIPYVRWVQN